MRPVRISAKAIIIRDRKVLLIRCLDAEGDWYLLPGGGQHHGESLTEAVERECLEEVGVQVEVGRLRFVRDYIGNNHEFAHEDAGVHQVELMFECSIRDGEEPQLGTRPDSQQTGVAWLELDELEHHRLYPSTLRELLARSDGKARVVYLGDVN